MNTSNAPNAANGPGRVQWVEISADYAGQRIDNYLLRILKGAPKSLIYKILRKGEVRVNRGRIRPDYRLQAGDQVRIPPLRLTEATPSTPPPALQARLATAILWEDQDILVLNKPAGVAVHKGSGLDFGVIEALRARRPPGAFLELAHRLDRDTSGCLLLAKNAEVLRAIHQALQQQTLEKRYLLLVRGQWPYGKLTVQAALAKVRWSGEYRMEIADQGKPAVTHFRPVSIARRASLLEATIATGRTHQIRVHAAAQGHPLAGDDKYGDAEFNRLAATWGLRRLFLHAHSLSLSLGGREIDVSAPLDDDLKAVLAYLETTT